ncbi:heterogeneous nuclear ribonucleoprotein 1-like isoform X2 [Andrographis paniculata]|uniref:heterogeneous nuclear ribonucleoprotein 1-like isoform X2 n=1 Tax=Andrographis paniculata TaxID=175694 RepID=UPI0021E7F87C|nr:heterogeneous nuclear ribonucleoprotein 1-like isoform X2 [Andrographis paniculata]
MEMEPVKLFVGGISWETNEERLREYFETFGEVVETVIIKDRATGCARGFGFAVFADASVAERVVKERHVIDGKVVEAKKAIPRDNHLSFNKNIDSSEGTPSPPRRKKVFVGGLPSSITENDFKRYFEQFGTITDIVVMYDHNTQRPRGFGFITYDSGEAVDRVLLQPFHELHGKRVEVKRAVPKELSPGPMRNSPSGSHGLNRTSSFLSPYNHLGYNSSPYGMRMTSRFSPANAGRSGYPRATGMSLDSAFGLSYGHGMSSYYNGNAGRFDSPNEYEVTADRFRTLFDSTNQRLWAGGNLNYIPDSIASNGFLGSRAATTGNLGRAGEIRGFNPVSARVGENFGYGHRESIFGGEMDHSILQQPHYNASDGGFGNMLEDKSFYSNHTWGASYPKIDSSAAFGYRHDAPSSRVRTPNNGVSIGYRGIAA